MNWVLDFDGTLIDSSHDIKVAINQLRSDVNLPPCSCDEVRDAIGHGALELLETLMPSSEDQSSEDWIEPFRDIYRDVCVEHVQPYDGIESWLDYLGPRRALVTNKPLSMTNPILEKLGWEHLFDRVLGPSSVEQPKPHPQPLELVMKHWDTDPSEVVMVGDNWTDIKAGKQAGTVTAGCLYGLGHTEQLREQSPDHLINSPSELFELV